jgi:hypothetical protein
MTEGWLTVLNIAASTSAVCTGVVVGIWAGRQSRGLDDLEASVGRRFDQQREYLSTEINSVHDEMARCADQLTIQNGRIRKVEAIVHRIQGRCETMHGPMAHHDAE